MNLRELDFEVADKVFKCIRYRENDSSRAIIKDENGSRYAMATWSKIEPRHLWTQCCPDCGHEHHANWERGDNEAEGYSITWAQELKQLIENDHPRWYA